MSNAGVSVEVVICTYNNGRSLDSVLGALAEQKVDPDVRWSALVVDNNCTDDTGAVVRDHLRRGRIPGLRLVAEPRQGLTYARHRGVISSTGDWIAFVDDDCRLQEDWVQQAATFAADHPECGAFGGRVVPTYETAPPSHVRKYGYAFAEQDEGPEPKRMPCLVGAGLVVRRGALKAVGWLEKQFMTDRVGKKLISGGDVELALRLGSSYELWYNPRCCLQHLIPAWRTSNPYLMKMNYGLGTSQLFGDSMLWARGSARFLLISAAETARASVRMLLYASLVLRRRMALQDLAIKGSFVLGRWAGTAHLLRMRRFERAALVGCARVSRSGQRR